tara:strand:+ start:171 stop:1106 length:936 start_codon:yes stop_codon:yes gene_type:complete
VTEKTAWVKYSDKSKGLGSFEISPLERGMGNTIGNALRRVLISSLEGYAVTSISVKGITHEFAAIPNVVEDVLDIICNIKALVFQVEGNEKEFEVSVSETKKGNVSAKEIKTPSNVKILNTNQHLFEISDKAQVEIKMVVKKGIGYRPSLLNKTDDTPVDAILIDSSFSPIINVNHHVDQIRVGKELDHDKLTLELLTDQSINPEDAVKSAVNIVINQFSIFQNINEKPKEETVVKEKDAESLQKSAMDMTIDDLELSARSSNCLKRAGIEIVRQLLDKDMADLIQIKNFGKKSADEINSKLSQYNLALKE